MFKAVVKYKNTNGLQQTTLCYDIRDILEDLGPEKYVNNEIDSRFPPLELCTVGEVPQSEILERLYPNDYKMLRWDILDELAYNIIMPQIEETDKVYTLDVDSRTIVEFSWLEDENE